MIPDAESSSSARCPVTGASSHEFIAPKQGDSRSPCPALNVLANHGYISRDGQNISATDVYYGLKKCYGLSTLFAAFLSYGGYILISRFGRSIPLREIGRHNRVEHDASLVHHNTPTGADYAPAQVDPDLVEALFHDIQSPTVQEVEAKKAQGEEAEILLGLEDIARARVRRENEAGPLNRLQARVARGEIGIAYSVFGRTVGGKTGIPGDVLRSWMQEERLPPWWQGPVKTTSYYDMLTNGNKIKEFVDSIKAEEEKKKD